ncbi:hypothetical protein CLOSBL3_11828 [Clostridiaceae bacterium BL-3]|nr:hypothetical protein CLOSBL3_11828 [Clostridiaceae bacterium BL-3]
MKHNTNSSIKETSAENEEHIFVNVKFKMLKSSNMKMHKYFIVNLN